MGPCGVEPTAQEGPPPSGRTTPDQTRGALTAEGLPRGHRLTRTADIKAVLSGGTRRRTSRLEIIWCANEHGHPRVGVITPRFGRSAVARNRLRRRLREHARRALLPVLPAIDFLIRTRPPAYQAGVSELARDLDRWRLQVTS